MNFTITGPDGAQIRLRSPSSTTGNVPLYFADECINLNPGQVEELIWWLAAFCAEGCADRGTPLPPLVALLCAVLARRKGAK